MEARVAFERDVVVVHLSGRVDIETAEPFRKVCLTRLMGRKVVFDFRSLGFVGSSGILPFVEIIQEFAEQNAAGFKFSGVSSEFRRIFSSTALGAIEIYEYPSQAIESFSNHAPAPHAAEPAPLLPIEDGEGSSGSSES